MPGLRGRENLAHEGVDEGGRTASFSVLEAIEYLLQRQLRSLHGLPVGARHRDAHRGADGRGNQAQGEGRNEERLKDAARHQTERRR